MKQDYLWDKTGEDPEIEKLESALLAFRYKETAPPALPAKIIPFETKSPRNFFRFFRLSYAFTAFAALMIVSLGVWFQFSGGKTEIAGNSAQPAPNPVVETVTNENQIENSDNFTLKNDLAVQNSGLSIEKNQVSKQSFERKIVKVKNIVPVKSRPDREINIARKTEVKNTPVKLTKDEKYAYDQLMLALSITSSKLKLVKDKVEGVEEPSASLDKGR
ncbi:MAG TPA: hypothetical protein VF556_06875 [Pyrinomonadaceae bacterium]|jgi:hypothetical protein